MLRFLTACLLLLLGGTVLAQTKIRIDGAEGAVSDNIRNHIGELPAEELQRPRQLRRKIDEAVRNATQALGYYETDYSYSVDGDMLRLDVALGLPTRWGDTRIEIEGEAADLPEARALIAAAPFDKTAIIDHSVYENFKRTLLETCQEKGFLDAHYAQSELIVDVDRRRAQVVLRMRGGSRYRFTAVQFEGTQLDQQLLARLSPVESGSYYDKATLTQLQRNLQQSRYFREIDVRTQKDNREFAVTAHLGDAPRHQLSVGAGYGTDTGPRGKLRWERPFVNTSGHKLNTELSISQPLQTLAFEYIIPLDPPLDHTLNYTSEWERKSVQDTDSEVGSLGFFFSSRYRDVWRINYGATFFNESYRQGNEPRKTVAYFAPDINLTQIVLPAEIDPRSGHKFWASALASTPELGADIAFARTDIGYKQIFNTFGSQLLIVRGEVGAIATGDIERIPASQRFFTGGDQTVRGYDFESLATKDANGELVGGRFLNAGSVEYSVKVADSWRVAAFADAGRAYNDESEPWRKSIGFGVRWLSPVGQVRVDIAAPIDDENSGFRLHIFIGPPL